jgi:hypothetical protein
VPQLENPARAPSRRAALRLPLVAASLTLVRVGEVAALSPPPEYYKLFEIGVANVIWVAITARLWQRDEWRYVDRYPFAGSTEDSLVQPGGLVPPGFNEIALPRATATAARRLRYTSDSGSGHRPRVVHRGMAVLYRPEFRHDVRLTVMINVWDVTEHVSAPRDRRAMALHCEAAFERETFYPFKVPTEGTILDVETVTAASAAERLLERIDGIVERAFRRHYFRVP